MKKIILSPTDRTIIPSLQPPTLTLYSKLLHFLNQLSLLFSPIGTSNLFHFPQEINSASILTPSILSLTYFIEKTGYAKRKLSKHFVLTPTNVLSSKHTGKGLFHPFPTMHWLPSLSIFGSFPLAL